VEFPPEQRSDRLRSLLDDYWKLAGGISIDDARDIARSYGFGFELGRVSRFENARNAVIIREADLRDGTVNRILLAEEIQHGLDRGTHEAARAIRRGLTNEQFHSELFQRILEGPAAGRFLFLTADDLAALRSLTDRLM
jgi:hypothetical protein